MPTCSAHILAIDDDPAMRDVYTDLFVDEGYRVSTEAVADFTRIAETAPDLLVLDYRGRGDQTAWALLQRLRAEPAFARLPVILCTGATVEMDVLAQEIAALGARVVLKPFDLDRLLGVVGELLGAWASSAPPMACTDQRARSSDARESTSVLWQRVLVS